MKKIALLSLSALLICTLTVPTLAVNNENEITVNEESNMTEITQFSYRIIDKEGNIKSSGVTANINDRYYWSGAVLENGDRIEFSKLNGENFYCLPGTTISYNMIKDIPVLTRCEFVNAYNDTTSNGEAVYIKDVSASIYTDFFDLPEESGISTYYYFAITNASSETVTIRDFTLLF